MVLQCVSKVSNNAHLVRGNTHALLTLALQVEFFFPGKDSLVEYRSASRIGESDGDINR